jgi:alpha-amylase
LEKNNPTKVLDNNSFYTIAEVYNYNISAGKYFDFGEEGQLLPTDSII